MTWFPCPYLNAPVELTEERRRHIRLRHGNDLPELDLTIASALAEPAVVGVPTAGPEIGFLRQLTSDPGGPWVVVVVLTDRSDVRESEPRYWVVTAYTAQHPGSWKPEWEAD